MHLGNAIHTLQDNTSPAHEGFKVWNAAWGRLHKNTILHVADELYDPGEGSKLDEATRIAQKLFLQDLSLPAVILPRPWWLSILNP